MAVLWKHRDEPGAYRVHSQVAYGENRIVEKYFPETLRLSRYEWDPRMAAALRQNMDDPAAYVSEVSAGLITRVTQKQALLLLAGLLALVGGAVFAWGRAK